MKKIILDFLHRGLIASGFGPIILAVIYLILQQTVGLEALAIEEVCIGIFSTIALSFVAGAINAIYQIERLPLMAAVFIHGIVLYICYLITYLLNDWLNLGVLPIVVFSVIFVVGYIVIWLIIYSVIKRNTNKINELMEQRRNNL